MNTLVDPLLNMADAADAGQRNHSGVSSGFSELDRVTSGLQPGNLLVLGGRPSMGKTALALNISAHVAIRELQPVLVFSMADSALRLKTRMLSSLFDIPLSSFRVNDIRDVDMHRLTEGNKKIGKYVLHIDESKHLSTSDIGDRANQLATKTGKLGLIVIDYLQLMDDQLPSGSSGKHRMNAVTTQLKSLATKQHCPVLLLSQVKSVADNQNNQRPKAKHLRDCSNLEKESDVIMMIYRENFYTMIDSPPDIAEINIVKNNNGSTGCVKLAFVKDYVRFESLAADQNLP